MATASLRRIRGVLSVSLAFTFSLPLLLETVLTRGDSFAPATAHAQQAAKVWRIGFLAAGARTSDGALPIALREALHELGYVEGRNVVYTGRWAEARRDRLPGMMAELIDLKVDLIVTFGGPASEAAKKATSTIPIVMSMTGDAAAIGLIASLARPGGNVTGISEEGTELSAKRLEILRETVPQVSRVAVLWNTGDHAMMLRYGEVERAARILRVALQPLGVREPEDLDAAFSAMARNRPDALFVLTDSLTTVHRKRILELSATGRIPAMYEFAFLVQDGGLMSYGPNFDDMFRRAALYVDRILKGAKPSDLPVEQPTRYYLVINLKTAKALGVTIPPSILLRVDRIIE